MGRKVKEGRRGKLKKRMVRIFSVIFLSLIVNALISQEGRGMGVPFCGLKVTLDPAMNRITGEGRYTVPEKTEGFISRGNLKITKLKVSNSSGREKDLPAGHVIRVGPGQTAVFHYEAVFPPQEEAEVIENVGVTGSNIIDEKGIMLISDWYPAINRPCLFGLEVTLPEEFEAISESNSITTVPDSRRGVKTLVFDFPLPLSGITLVGGKYALREERYRDVLIRTYFFPAEDHLSAVYRGSVRKYIDLYGEMLGDYPFDSYSVVENIFQTGYSFPTYTLLGSMIIPLKYVPETSLGHEFLHQWFGHLIEVDREQGNWSEGLTTYLADHWYKELKGEGHVYRKKILIDYMNYVTPSRDIPVSKFQGRVDFATRAIGYGKTAMIFHMARKMLGNDLFFFCLKKFIEERGGTEAGWDDLRDSFAETGGRDVAKLFDIWTSKTGMAELKISPSLGEGGEDDFVLAIDVAQKNGPYFFNLPLTVETEDSREFFLIKIDAETVRFTKTFGSRPVRVTVDEEYDTFRRLGSAEFPPVISGFTGDKDSLVIVPETKKNSLGEVARFFKIQGFRVVEENEVKEDMLRRSSFLFLSADPKTLLGLPGFPRSIEFPNGGFAVKVLRNPLNPNKVAVLFNFKDVNELKMAFKKMFRYGNYSLIVFERGKNILKKTDPVERGLVYKLPGTEADQGETSWIIYPGMLPEYPLNSLSLQGSPPP